MGKRNVIIPENEVPQFEVSFHANFLHKVVTIKPKRTLDECVII